MSFAKELSLLNLDGKDAAASVLSCAEHFIIDMGTVFDFYVKERKVVATKKTTLKIWTRAFLRAIGGTTPTTKSYADAVRKGSKSHADALEALQVNIPSVFPKRIIDFMTSVLSDKPFAYGTLIRNYRAEKKIAPATKDEEATPFSQEEIKVEGDKKESPPPTPGQKPEKAPSREASPPRAPAGKADKKEKKEREEKDEKEKMEPLHLPSSSSSSSSSSSHSTFSVLWFMVSTLATFLEGLVTAPKDCEFCHNNIKSYAFDLEEISPTSCLHCIHLEIKMAILINELKIQCPVKSDEESLFYHYGKRHDAKHLATLNNNIRIKPSDNAGVVNGHKHTLGRLKSYGFHIQSEFLPLIPNGDDTSVPDCFWEMYFARKYHCPGKQHFGKKWDKLKYAITQHTPCYLHTWGTETQPDGVSHYTFIDEFQTNFITYEFWKKGTTNLPAQRYPSLQTDFEVISGHMENQRKFNWLKRAAQTVVDRVANFPAKIKELLQMKFGTVTTVPQELVNKLITLGQSELKMLQAILDWQFEGPPQPTQNRPPVEQKGQGQPNRRQRRQRRPPNQAQGQNQSQPQGNQQNRQNRFVESTIGVPPVIIINESKSQPQGQGQQQQQRPQQQGQGPPRQQRRGNNQRGPRNNRQGGQQQQQQRGRAQQAPGNYYPQVNQQGRQQAPRVQNQPNNLWLQAFGTTDPRQIVAKIVAATKAPKQPRYDFNRAARYFQNGQYKFGDTPLFITNVTPSTTQPRPQPNQQGPQGQAAPQRPRNPSQGRGRGRGRGGGRGRGRGASNPGGRAIAPPQGNAQAPARN
jgi:hypothetical protein